MRIGPASARQSNKTRLAVGDAHKISTDIRHILPPFFTGGQNVPNFGPNFDHSRLRTAIFLYCGGLLEKKHTCQGLMIAVPSYQSWSGWVPPTPRTVGAFGTPKGKSGKFLIYPLFQRPTPCTPPPMLHHLLGL